MKCALYPVAAHGSDGGAVFALVALDVGAEGFDVGVGDEVAGGVGGGVAAVYEGGWVAFFEGVVFAAECGVGVAGALAEVAEGGDDAGG